MAARFFCLRTGFATEFSTEAVSAQDMLPFFSRAFDTHKGGCVYTEFAVVTNIFGHKRKFCADYGHKRKKSAAFWSQPQILCSYFSEIVTRKTSVS